MLESEVRSRDIKSITDAKTNNVTAEKMYVEEGGPQRAETPGSRTGLQ